MERNKIIFKDICYFNFRFKLNFNVFLLVMLNLAFLIYCTDESADRRRQQ